MYRQEKTTPRAARDGHQAGHTPATPAETASHEQHRSQETHMKTQLYVVWVLVYMYALRRDPFTEDRVVGKGSHTQVEGVLSGHSVVVTG